MTADNGSEFSVGAVKLADKAVVSRARARGEMYGFAGAFLASFIERELRLMVKWRDRSTAVKSTLSAPPGSSPSKSSATQTGGAPLKIKSC
jgi:hypothetical protein